MKSYHSRDVSEGTSKLFQSFIYGFRAEDPKKGKTTCFVKNVYKLTLGPHYLFPLLPLFELWLIYALQLMSEMTS